MANFVNAARLYDSDVDDVVGDVDLFCDLADSPLSDLPANAGEFSDLNAWLNVSEDDSVIADAYNEIDEYRKRFNVSDDTIPVNAGLSFEHPVVPVRDSLRRNMSKNAVLARENREKKKRYISGLEKSVHDLSVKNKKLVQGCAAMHNTIASLRREVNYLRGVIENQSQLARLLKHIPTADHTCQLPENSSLFVDESEIGNATSLNEQPLSASSLNSSELLHTELMPTADCESLLIEHDYARSERRNKWNNSSHRQFGVCLHVANQSTSLQLCASCNENAQ